MTLSPSIQLDVGDSSSVPESILLPITQGGNAAFVITRGLTSLAMAARVPSYDN